MAGRESSGGEVGASEGASAILAVRGLKKVYASGFQALAGVDLEVRRGEIFALLGPNGAGKTTLINIVCGIVRASAGMVSVDGRDIERDWRAARATIGLVPQELTTDAFETVMATIRFSRGLFGKPRDDAFLERVLRDLSLFDKRDEKILALSGGMKRRVMIAKALAHEPTLLFLDEPTAGVDVELRRDLWDMVRGLRQRGVTIILTTHYIEEAEQMADRVGVIDRGRLILVEDKAALMRQLGRKELILHLATPMAALPPALAGHGLALTNEGRDLVYAYETRGGSAQVAELMRRLDAAGVAFTDLSTRESSLEDIFVGLVSRRPGEYP